MAAHGGSDRSHVEVRRVASRIVTGGVEVRPCLSDRLIHGEPGEPVVAVACPPPSPSVIQSRPHVRRRARAPKKRARRGGDEAVPGQVRRPWDSGHLRTDWSASGLQISPGHVDAPVLGAERRSTSTCGEVERVHRAGHEWGRRTGPPGHRWHRALRWSGCPPSLPRRAVLGSRRAHVAAMRSRPSSPTRPRRPFRRDRRRRRRRCSCPWRGLRHRSRPVVGVVAIRRVENAAPAVSHCEITMSMPPPAARPR